MPAWDEAGAEVCGGAGSAEAHRGAEDERFGLEKFARLARIALRAEEMDALCAEIASMMSVVDDVLGAGGAENTDGTSDACRALRQLRADVAQTDLAREELLAAVPEMRDGYIVVPRVVREENA